MTRPLRAIIDHSALSNNLQRVRSAAPGCRIMAVVKANAYGHGAAEVAATLVAAGADGVAVISLAEAMVLRRAGITAPITLLQGFFDPVELPLISQQRLSVVLHQPAQITTLGKARLERPLSVWVKVDTGMHRLGLTPEQLPQAIAALQRCAAVTGPVGLLSHLASADIEGDAGATEQICRFQRLCAEAPQMPTSLANSAAILGWLQSHAGWVRPGIMLYGASPFSNGRQAAELGLRAVMTLRSALISVRHLRRGDKVGYGGSWTCPEDMPVGLVACGYGDGYPRHAPSGTPVSVAGKRVALIGRVSMDSLCVDLRPCPGAQVGDEVVLWGDEPGIDEVASAAGTIAYEPLTQITARVPV